jgi:hypothetical protein
MELWSAIFVLGLASVAVWFTFWPNTVPEWIKFIVTGVEAKEPEEEEV